MAGTALIGQDASMTAPLPAQRSFWDRITGRNRPADQANRGKSWFRSNTQPQNIKRPAAAKTKTSAKTTKTNHNGWRLFGKR
ncbi:MAG: hypothetical protein B7Z41_03595 [Rhizobiales bacterium 12-66-7]|nr:MAG: hypothetical protein B7Z41_03595 [Rhizobiales bacterium 12-66-7]